MGLTDAVMDWCFSLHASLMAFLIRRARMCRGRRWCSTRRHRCAALTERHDWHTPCRPLVSAANWNEHFGSGWDRSRTASRFPWAWRRPYFACLLGSGMRSRLGRDANLPRNGRAHRALCAVGRATRGTWGGRLWRRSPRPRPFNRRAKAAGQFRSRRGSLCVCGTRLRPHPSGAAGPLKDAPIRYAGALVSSCAATTMEFMLTHPEQSDVICHTGLETVWHALH